MSREQQLFGGAITARLPIDFVDVSNFRSIPDHQEVYGNIDTDQSIIIELLSSPSDILNENAALFHFNELADTNEAQDPQNHAIFDIKHIPVNELPNFTGIDIFASYLFGRQNISKFHEAARNSVNIYLCLIRIPRVQTDLLITYNEPIALSQESSSFNIVDPNKFSNRLPVLPVFEDIARSIKIIDWGLFQ